MISLPGIVLVDDTKEDLDAIQNSITCSGYPCFPIHYQNDEPSNITGIDHVNLELLNFRVIITDLNLQELQVDATKLVGPIAEVLQKLTTEGPYVLYFWSKNANTVSEVMDLIEKRYRDTVHFPLHWGILDKAHYKNHPNELVDKVKGLFSENPVFNALFEWENRVSTSAQRTTDSLFKLAVPAETTGIVDFQSQVTTKLQTMLAVIGNETIGYKNAKEEPELAIELGLEPVLHDHIQSTYEHIEDSVWVDAAKGIGTHLDADNDVKAHLNSFYHLVEVTEGAQKNKRGTWVELESSYFDVASNSSKIERNLGKELKVILHDEFLNPSAGEGSKSEQKSARKKAREATKLGFIEVSAECDQAQRKTKFHRYFLSALIPVEYADFTIFRGGENDTAHAGIYRLPNLTIGGEEYIVKISFMYPIGTIPTCNKWLGKPLFRLKDQILADISFKASQHTSRPGIIRFD